MLIAAMRMGHALAGKAVVFNDDDGTFEVTGQGRISAATLLQLDRDRQLDWADGATRDWVLETAALKARKEAKAAAEAAERAETERVAAEAERTAAEAAAAAQAEARRAEAEAMSAAEREAAEKAAAQQAAAKAAADQAATLAAAGADGSTVVYPPPKPRKRFLGIRAKRTTFDLPPDHDKPGKWVVFAEPVAGGPAPVPPAAGQALPTEAPRAFPAGAIATPEAKAAHPPPGGATASGGRPRTQAFEPPVVEGSQPGASAGLESLPGASGTLRVASVSARRDAADGSGDTQVAAEAEAPGGTGKAMERRKARTLEKQGGSSTVFRVILFIVLAVAIAAAYYFYHYGGF